MRGASTLLHLHCSAAQLHSESGLAPSQSAASRPARPMQQHFNRACQRRLMPFITKETFHQQSRIQNLVHCAHPTAMRLVPC